MKKILALVVAGLFSATAQATVIDFEDVWLPKAQTLSGNLNKTYESIMNGSVSSQGYNLSSTFDQVGGASSHMVLANNFKGNSGSTFLAIDSDTVGSVGNTLTLKAANGGLFSLIAFDYGYWGSDSDYATTVKIIGQVADGSTKSTSVFPIGNNFAATSAGMFAGWENLSSVSFRATDGIALSRLWGIDNIQVEQPGTVSAPGSLALLGLGLAGMAFVSRRKKAA